MSVKINQREVPSWLPVSFRAMNKGFREKVRVLSDVSPAAKEKEGMGQRWKSFSQRMSSSWSANRASLAERKGSIVT